MMQWLVNLLIALILGLFAMHPIQVETPWVECGCCGAHVTEWWYVRNMADTEFVEVCHDCYECFRQ